MKSILLLDCNALGWSAFHALPPLEHRDKGTGVIYGFINYLFELQGREHADHIVFTWDSRHSKRKEIFPEYKAKRMQKKSTRTEEEIVIHDDRARQFRELRTKVLPALGFSNILHEEGYEGDDLIASIVHTHGKNHFIKIVATDGDLYQLINSNCVMYNHTKRVVIDEEDIFDQHGVYPDMWAEIKAISGCRTDEVPGIEGVAEKTAVKYLLGTLKNTTKTYQKIENGAEVIKLTRKLTTLPFEGTPTYELLPDTCKVRKLKSVAREYGLGTYLQRERLKHFRRLFCYGKKNTENKG